MSGGVDSSVAAALLKEAGHDVVGATLKLWGGASDSGCCSVSDVDDARRVAQMLDIDHHVFNYTEEFDRHVVAPFIAGYTAGESPNPCIECNRHIKFDVLFERAQRLGFDAVATGHHAQVRQGPNGPELVRGADPAKDQSYVLGYLTSDQLAQLLLPIGHMNKSDVRAEAERLGLRTWDKPDSQDVCFIEASAGREAFLRARIPLTTAEIVDEKSGVVIGTTDAAEMMTLGQRKGVLPDRHGEKRFVSRVDLKARRVSVGRLEDILVSELALNQASVTFARREAQSGEDVLVQVSAHGTPLPGRLVRDEAWRVVFDAPVRPVAAGQSAVFYDVNAPDVVVGAALVASGA